MSYRTLKQVINAQPTSDGDGVKINRIAGGKLARQLDPFLLIDEIRSEDGADYIGGFPPHPHRGFETITYMLEGAMRHRDHMGNEGVIEGGDVQWMTAGRGVIHSEMPEQTDGLLPGFQVWLNLAATEKMQSARYQEYRDEQLPVLLLTGGGQLKLIAGSAQLGSEQHSSPITSGITQANYFDLQLTAGEQFELPVDAAQTVLVLVYQGATSELSSQQLGVYAQGDVLSISASNQGARALLLTGTPLAEPIKQYGPFVMNTSEQIEQAIRDYNNGQLVG